MKKLLAITLILIFMLQVAEAKIQVRTRGTVTQEDCIAALNTIPAGYARNIDVFTCDSRKIKRYDGTRRKSDYYKGFATYNRGKYFVELTQFHTLTPREIKELVAHEVGHTLQPKISHDGWLWRFIEKQMYYQCEYLPYTPVKVNWDFSEAKIGHKH